MAKPNPNRGATTLTQAGLAEGFAGWRFYLVCALMLCGVLALLWRVIDLQVFDKEFLRTQGDLRTIRTETITAHRGMILDRHGEPLAVSTPVETIWANPQEVNLDDPKLASLAQALDMPLTELKQQLSRSRQREFIYLRRQMSPSQARAVSALGLSGIYTRQEYKRYYPAGEVAAHLVGFTNIDEKGQEGLELIYDQWMSGVDGKKTVLKDRRGYIVKDLNLVADAEPGNNLQLSVDLRLQYLAYRELKAAAEAHKAVSANLVMLDAKTGEVLAMVNQPSYNPNNRANLQPAALRNRAVTDLFEPGSTVKVITMAAALESGKFSPSTVVDTSPGWMRMNGRTIRDYRDYGELDLTSIITKSSNIGTSRIGLALTGEVLYEMFSRFGFGQASGIEFPGEGIGSLPFQRTWAPIRVATLSYGYGLSMTPLQLARAYAVFANNGKRKPVSLLKGGHPEPAEPIMAPKVAAQVRDMLATVVEKGGTGTRAAVPFFRVAGKTGTVHTIGANGYESDQYLSIFAGMAPVDDPKVVMVVIVDRPQSGAYYGGEVAAPVFGRVMAGAMRLLNVPPAPTATAGRTTEAAVESTGQGRG